MSTLATPQPLAGAYHSFRRWTVDEYHRMIDAGILTDEDKVELLEGYVVLKMPRNAPHDGTIDLVDGALDRVVPSGWFLRIQQAVTLTDSEPEPDVAVVRGNRRSYLKHHPTPGDIGLLVEIANTSLDRDRDDKTRIYARAGILCYWIVNLSDARIEVYTQPSGPTAVPAYAQRQDHRAGDMIPLQFDGITVGTVVAADLLP
jgi:Uma2 family endonuclease